MLEITLARKWFTEQSTIGELAAGNYGCFSLEDRVRAPGVKVYGETAIPCGRYMVVMTESPRFQRVLPELLGVPRFSDIRIHAGNVPLNTHGCILTGTQRRLDFVQFSRAALYPLLDILQAAADRGEEMWISITDQPAPDQTQAYTRLVDPTQVS